MNDTSKVTKSSQLPTVARPEQPRKAETKDSGKSVTTNITTDGRKNRAVVAIMFIIVIVLIVVLAVVLPRNKDTEEEPPEEIPTAVDFITGVSLLTYYGVNATITSRLSTTVLTIVAANGLNCTSIHGITLQLPLAARVTSLKTMADDGCNTYGKVQTLKEARETFVETASHGLPGAYIEERDLFTHSVQVAMPPLGKTKVELMLEELLQQRVGQVEFFVPFTPNEEVDKVKLNIRVLDISPEPLPTEPPPTVETINGTVQVNETNVQGLDFYLDLNLPNLTANATDRFQLDIPDAREHELPKVLSGYYKPRQLPENGVLYMDGTCFEHYFSPSNIVPMRKNIFFLVDISESNYYHEKFQAIKAALNKSIDSLEATDTLTIQAFAERGTEKLWGSARATEEEKKDAKAWVHKLRPECCETNLHEAYLEGLLRAKRDADQEGVVTILVMLSDSWPTRGETRRPKIASDVWQLNQEGKVKMFSLAFHDADRQLLNAIAIMNGGVALPLLEGYVDYASQMERFFDSQFGDILLSDVQVDFAGEVEAFGETQRAFPVLADGSEIVIRGLLANHTTTPLQAITTAMTSAGDKTWTVSAVQDPFASMVGLPNSRCFQSYAHSRINQLMHWRDAAELLGDEVLAPVVYLTQPCEAPSSLVDCIEQEALSLALHANVVAEGLTGMATVDEDKCQTFEEETEICLDGTSVDGNGMYPEGGWDGDDYAPTAGDEAGYVPTAGATSREDVFIALNFALLFWLMLDMLICMI